MSKYFIFILSVSIILVSCQSGGSGGDSNGDPMNPLRISSMSLNGSVMTYDGSNTDFSYNTIIENPDPLVVTVIGEKEVHFEFEHNESGEWDIEAVELIININSSTSVISIEESENNCRVGTDVPPELTIGEAFTVDLTNGCMLQVQNENEIVQYNLVPFYAISTEAGLANIPQIDKDTTTNIENLTKFVLLGDIVLASAINSYVPEFYGHFDGRGFSLTDVFITSVSEDYLGLFGRLLGNAIVENLNVSVIGIAGLDYVGGLAGEWNGAADSRISNVTVNLEGAVNGNNYIGGIFGQLMGDGTIEELVFNHTEDENPNVFGDSYIGGYAGFVDNDMVFSGLDFNLNITSNTEYAGGIFGVMSGTNSLTNSSSNGTIICGKNCGGLVGLITDEASMTDSNFSGSIVASDNFTGGIIGNFNSTGTFENLSSNSSEISGVSRVGGIIGLVQGIEATTNLNNFTSDATIIATGEMAGGLIANVNSTNASFVVLSDSSFTGSVEASRIVGGLIGFFNGGYLNDSFATSNVTSTTISSDAKAGGLIGTSGINFTLNNSYYADGTVSASTEFVGGLIGDSSGITNNSYSVATEVISTGDDVGGIVGLIDKGEINYSFARTTVKGDKRVGGIVGRSDNKLSKINNSYFIGTLEGNLNIGGIAGAVYTAKGLTVNNSFTSCTIIPSATNTHWTQGNLPNDSSTSPYKYLTSYGLCDISGTLQSRWRNDVNSETDFDATIGFTEDTFFDASNWNKTYDSTTYHMYVLLKHADWAFDDAIWYDPLIDAINGYLSP